MVTPEAGFAPLVSLNMEEMIETERRRRFSRVSRMAWLRMRRRLETRSEVIT